MTNSTLEIMTAGPNWISGDEELVCPTFSEVGIRKEIPFNLRGVKGMALVSDDSRRVFLSTNRDRTFVNLNLSGMYPSRPLDHLIAVTYKTEPLFDQITSLLLDDQYDFCGYSPKDASKILGIPESRFTDLGA